MLLLLLACCCCCCLLAAAAAYTESCKVHSCGSKCSVCCFGSEPPPVHACSHHNVPSARASKPHTQVPPSRNSYHRARDAGCSLYTAPSCCCCLIVRRLLSAAAPAAAELEASTLPLSPRAAPPRPRLVAAPQPPAALGLVALFAAAASPPNAAPAPAFTRLRPAEHLVPAKAGAV